MQQTKVNPWLHFKVVLTYGHWAACGMREKAEVLMGE